MRKALGIAAIGTVSFAIGMTLAPVGSTYSAFSDNRVLRGNEVHAGTWGPIVPAECADMKFDNVLYVPRGGEPFTGTNHNDLIFANDSGDTIDGGDGDDCIVGGDGNDILTGGNGKDVILGGPGNDTINGGNAPDSGLYGGPGDDVINGDNGPDHLDGGDGNDTCSGGHAPDAPMSCEHSS